MHIATEHRLDALPSVVWAALTDNAIVRRSLPGCQELAARGDGRFEVTVRMRIGGGAAAMRLVGSVTVAELDPPQGCRLAFASQPGAADSAVGSIRLQLQPTDHGTSVRCEIDATLGGRLAERNSGESETAAQAFAAAFLRRLAAQTTLPDPLLVQPPRVAAAAGSETAKARASAAAVRVLIGVLRPMRPSAGGKVPGAAPRSWNRVATEIRGTGVTAREPLRAL